MPPKSRSEINRDYRNRKKQKEGEEFMEAERERVKKYFVPAAQITKENKDGRNKKKAEAMRRLRESRRLQRKPKLSPLIVKIGPTSNRSSEKKLRARKDRQIKKLQANLDLLERKCSTFAKRNQRLSTKLEGRRGHQTSTPEALKTPIRKAGEIMRQEGISPSIAPKVRRELISCYSVLAEVKEANKMLRNKSKQPVAAIVSGRILKKYRSMTYLATNTDMDRNYLYNLKTKNMKQRKKTRMLKKREQLRKKVKDFLCRDDNSRVVPAKKEVKKTEDGICAKRMLTDYMYNLHAKFLAEEPGIKLSLTTFQRLRPSNITQVSFLSKQECLCSKHQNFALLLKALNQAGASVSSNPDSFIKQHANVEEIFSDVTNEVRYKIWKSVEVPGIGKRVRLLDENKAKNKFKDMFQKEMSTFSEHVERVQKQYVEVKRMKENLPKGHVAVQMDFSENYSPRYAHEVQSAYWNSTAITLHPCVAYYKTEDGVLEHSSFAVVSDTKDHSKNTVFAILCKLIPQLRETLPDDVEYIHYITDSPVSQYRNKHMFYTVQEHNALFGVPCSWTYFEAGHGKGPCDGIGAVIKRMADDHIKQEKVVMQCARDLYEWGMQVQKTIKYIFLSQADIAEFSLPLNVTLTAIPATHSIHAVIGTAENGIATRTTSCFCDRCFHNGVLSPHCEGWVCHSRRCPSRVNVRKSNRNVRLS